MLIPMKVRTVKRELYKMTKITMTFKTMIFTTIAILSLSTNTKAQNACPVNFGDKQLETAKLEIKKWNGEIVACNVEVMQV